MAVHLKGTLSSSRFFTATVNVGVTVVCKSQSRLCCDTLGPGWWVLEVSLIWCYFLFCFIQISKALQVCIDMLFLLIGRLCDKHATDVRWSVNAWRRCSAESWGLQASISFVPPPLPLASLLCSCPIINRALGLLCRLHWKKSLLK